MSAAAGCCLLRWPHCCLPADAKVTPSNKYCWRRLLSLRTCLHTQNTPNNTRLRRARRRSARLKKRRLHSRLSHSLPLSHIKHIQAAAAEEARRKAEEEEIARLEEEEKRKAEEKERKKAAAKAKKEDLKRQGKLLTGAWVLGFEIPSLRSLAAACRH